MIQRIFHPIGQGAFYSERHDNFNIVYDCGIQYVDRGSQRAEKVVKASFKKNSQIDILFISHFDYDHVSKIETLKNNFKIKKVILPLLHKDEKILLTNFYETIGIEDNIQTLINNPSGYFNEETRIITVNPGEDLQSPIEGELTDIENLGNIIESGKNIKFDHWLFIPFNIENNLRHQKLLNLFKNAI